MTQQETKLASARARKYSLDLSRYYRNPSTKVSLSIVLSVFIVIFFILVAIKPTFVTIAKLNVEIEESEKTLTQLIAKTDALIQAASVWESLQPSIPYVKASIPRSGPEYAKLTKTIEVLALESGVGITSLTVGESLLYSQATNVFEGREQEVIEVPLTVRVIGEFAQVLDFLEEMLKVDRLVGLESVTINREVEGADSTTVGLAMTGNVQYLANSKILNKILNAEGK